MANEKRTLDSILLSVKKMIGLTEEYKQFDDDLIMHINSAFAVLNQLGVGPKVAYSISGENENWSEFLTDQNVENVKSYMYMKVKMLFDPPSTATMHEAFERQIQEMEWRLNVAVDPSPKDEDNEE